MLTERRYISILLSWSMTTLSISSDHSYLLLLIDDSEKALLHFQKRKTLPVSRKKLIYITFRMNKQIYHSECLILKTVWLIWWLCRDLIKRSVILPPAICKNYSLNDWIETKPYRYLALDSLTTLYQQIEVFQLKRRTMQFMNGFKH